MGWYENNYMASQIYRPNGLLFNHFMYVCTHTCNCSLTPWNTIALHCNGRWKEVRCQITRLNEFFQRCIYFTNHLFSHLINPKVGQYFFQKCIITSFIKWSHIQIWESMKWTHSISQNNNTTYKILFIFNLPTFLLTIFLFYEIQ